MIDVRFKTTCPRPAGTGAVTATVTLSAAGGQVFATATTTVTRAGRWFATLTVPAGTPSGAHVLSARCSTEAGSYLAPTSHARSP